jgi:hypothetical protein
VPRWVLGCPKCNLEFTQSVIDSSRQSSLEDPFAWIGEKPQFPGNGLRVECPNCKNISVYQRYQLVYRSN